jgi:hypothetical protein
MRKQGRTAEIGEESQTSQLCAIPARAKGSNGVRAERVEYVAGLMATGEFRRGKTAKELVKMWGLSLQSVHEICSEASRAVQCSVNVSDVLRTFSESLDELLSLGHECRATGKPREAIVAFAKVAELCMQVTRNRDGLPSGDDSRLDTVQKLIAAGWTPPAPEGLPAPTLDDPEMNDDD